MSLSDLKDLPTLIATIGLYGVWLIVFLESSLVFFLPGDSLLFVAGFLASQGLMPIHWLILGCTVAGILGNFIGYFLGKRYGRTFFAKEKGRFFNAKNLAKTEEFYAKYGKMALILARFLPVVRTFAPIFAGISAMNYRMFIIYNIIGAVLWCGGLCLLGYFLGQLIPPAAMEKYLIVIVLAIIVLSFLPAVVHYLKAKKAETPEK